MIYSRQDLLLVNSNTELDQSIKDKIGDLGICFKTNKRFRGRRSGARVKKRDQHSIDPVLKNDLSINSIPVLQRNRTNKVNSVNPSVRIFGFYQRNRFKIQTLCYSW